MIFGESLVCLDWGDRVVNAHVLARARELTKYSFLIVLRCAF